jgi:hypothetical protein
MLKLTKTLLSIPKLQPVAGSSMDVRLPLDPHVAPERPSASCHAMTGHRRHTTTHNFTNGLIKYVGKAAPARFSGEFIMLWSVMSRV